MDDKILTATEYLKARFYHFPDGWVGACFEFLLEEHQENRGNFNINNWCRLIEQQWLYTDIRELETSNGIVLRNNVEKFSAVLCFQVNKCINIAKSLYSQIQELTGSVNQNVFVTAEPTQSNYKSEHESNRTLLLDLTDGVSNFQGLEFKSWNHIKSSDLIGGCKIRLKGPFMIKNRVALLRKENIEFIGGEVDEISSKSIPETIHDHLKQNLIKSHIEQNENFSIKPINQKPEPIVISQIPQSQVPLDVSRNKSVPTSVQSKNTVQLTIEQTYNNVQNRNQAIATNSNQNVPTHINKDFQINRYSEISTNRNEEFQTNRNQNFQTNRNEEFQTNRYQNYQTNRNEISTESNQGFQTNRNYELSTNNNQSSAVHEYSDEPSLFDQEELPQIQTFKQTGNQMTSNHNDDDLDDETLIMMTMDVDEIEEENKQVTCTVHNVECVEEDIYEPFCYISRIEQDFHEEKLRLSYKIRGFILKFLTKLSIENEGERYTLTVSLSDGASSLDTKVSSEYISRLIGLSPKEGYDSSHQQDNVKKAIFRDGVQKLQKKLTGSFCGMFTVELNEEEQEFFITDYQKVTYDTLSQLEKRVNKIYSYSGV